MQTDLFTDIQSRRWESKDGNQQNQCDHPYETLPYLSNYASPLTFELTKQLLNQLQRKTLDEAK